MVHGLVHGKWHGAWGGAWHGAWYGAWVGGGGDFISSDYLETANNDDFLMIFR